MVDPQKYREKSTKTITTRSGESFTIEKLSPFRLLEILAERGISFEDIQNETGKREKGMEIAKVLLPECVKDLAPSGEGDDTRLGLDEIKELSEIEDLLDAVLESMGAGEEDKEKAENFRSEPDGADGGTDSEDVPGSRTADGDPETTA